MFVVKDERIRENQPLSSYHFPWLLFSMDCLVGEQAVLSMYEIKGYLGQNRNVRYWMNSVAS